MFANFVISLISAAHRISLGIRVAALNVTPLQVLCFKEKLTLSGPRSVGFDLHLDSWPTVLKDCHQFGPEATTGAARLATPSWLALTPSPTS